MRTTVLGGLIAAKQALPHMLANGSGSIIFNSSIASLAGDVSQFSYGGAKAAVNWYVRAIAANYGPRGVRCNGILPGVIKTFAQSAWVTPEIDADRKSVVKGKGGSVRVDPGGRRNIKKK